MPVNTLHPDVETWLPVWMKNMDAYMGDRVIRFGDKQRMYLPKLDKSQSDPDYETFKGRSYFLEATSRSVDGLVGVALWKPPVIDLPSTLIDFITEEQTKEILTELYQTARYGIMVDMSSDKKMIMPIYAAMSIINYRLYADGTFKWVVLEETLDDSSKDDKYIRSPITVYRELRINEDGNYEQVMHLPDGKNGWTEDTENIVTPLKDNSPLKTIPFRIYNTIKASANIEPPPISGIVNSNIGYYQIYTEIRHKYHWSAIIQPVISGVNPEDVKELKIGKTVWGMKDPGARAELLETPGNCFGALREGLQGELDVMSSLGARLLEPQKKAAEATETVRLRQTAEVATISSVVATVEGSIQWAIGVAAEWKGVSLDPKEVFKMSRDFFTSELSHERIREITGSWLAGALDDKNLYLNWRDGELIKNQMTEEDFIKELNKKRKEMLIDTGIDG